ncbi:restriction endonuclease subunit S [Arenibacter algicola]|uniref:Type I restriction modification DNA specificity domain protein n=1 Tax=Arenibacter algicola TaxID=616991 RepID=A0A221UYZ0_9FLAO|nr:restriction endonuclease subunit S [Arenibacter algicola]ASO06552.1 type I restriction modification DNA specificity domain protein [Arenibacter algicola]
MNKISTKRLGDILNFKRGYDLPLSSREDGAIPVISSAGISGCHSEFKAEGEGVITGRYGTLGEVYYVEGKYWPHNTTLYVTDFKSNYPKYVYYLLKCLGNLKTSDKSAVPGINRNDLHEVRVPYIKGSRQIEIANILDNLDAKIEVNNKINAELEAMAKLIYDYWFVQFDFPNEDGKPYKSSGGKMVYNKELKREIPEGWEVKTINESVEKIIDHRGKTPKKLGGDWSNNKDDIIALSAKIVKNGYLIKLEDANRVSKELFDKWMPEKLRDGDVLLTSEAPAGEMFFILGKTDYCMSQRLFALRANPKVILPSLLYYEIAKGNAHFQIQGSLSGSTVFGIRQDVLRTINVLVPNTKVQTQFDDKVLPILKKIKILVQQNQKLSELRDWLLPMLMNGQVTVANEELGITNAELGNDLGMVAEDNGKYGEV